VRFAVASEPLAGLKVVERRSIVDHRGSLTRMFCQDDFRNLGIDPAVAQINLTVSKTKGAVRGMHFQLPPHAEAKTISCVRGAVFDVAVDIRRGSATFLQWHAEELTAQNKRTLHIPPGFAHGFQCLEPNSALLYVHSAPFAPGAESGLNANDDTLSITWPLAITDLSDRDQGHTMIADAFEGLTI